MRISACSIDASDVRSENKSDEMDVMTLYCMLFGVVFCVMLYVV